MEKFLKNILVALVGISFFLPFLFFPDSFVFPFVVPKALAFRTLTLIMLGVYIVLLFTNYQKYKLKPTALNIAVIVYFLSISISTLFAFDVYRALWDGHERMLGVFTIFHYIIYYFILVGTGFTKREWQIILRLAVCMGFALMISGMYQKMFPHAFWGRGERIASTLGNSIYFAGASLFVFFISLLAYLQERNPWLKGFALFSAGCGILGMVLSGTRGTILGWMVSGVLMLLMYVYCFRENTKLRKIVIAFLGGIILLGGVFFIFKDTSVIQNSPTLRRFSNISFSEGSGRTRILFWSIAIDAWKEKPIVGWGPNNFYHAHNKYYHPELLRFGYGESWVDNAHNIIFNTLTTRGVVGVLAYLFLYLAAFKMLIDAKKRKSLWWSDEGKPIHDISKYKKLRISKANGGNNTDFLYKNNTYIFIVCIGFLVAHCIHNFFVFENLTSYLHFFFFLALLHSFLEKKENTTKIPFSSQKRYIGITLTTVFMIFLCYAVYVFNILPAKANMNLLTTLKHLKSGSNPVAAYESLDDIHSMHSDDIKLTAIDTVIEIIPYYNRVQRLEESFTLARYAYNDALWYLQLHPFDSRMQLRYARVAQRMYEFTSDTLYLEKASEMLLKAKEYSPSRQELYYEHATVLVRAKKMNEAIEMLHKAFELDTVQAETYWRIALLYYNNKDTEMAKQWYEKMKNENLYFKKYDREMLVNLEKIFTTQNNASS